MLRKCPKSLAHIAPLPYLFSSGYVAIDQSIETHGNPEDPGHTTPFLLKLKNKRTTSIIGPVLLG